MKLSSLKSSSKRISLIAFIFYSGALSPCFGQNHKLVPTASMSHFIDSARIYDLSIFCSSLSASTPSGRRLNPRNRSAIDAVCRSLEHSDNNTDVISLISQTPAFQSMRAFEYLSGSGQGRIAVMAPGVAELVEGARSIETPLAPLPTQGGRRRSVPRLSECERARVRYTAQYWNQAARHSEIQFQDIVRQQALYLERLVNQMNASVGTLQSEVEHIQERSLTYTALPNQTVQQRIENETLAVRRQFIDTLALTAQSVFSSYFPERQPDLIYSVQYSIKQNTQVALRSCTQIHLNDDEYRILCTVYSYPMGVMFGVDVASAAAAADGFRDIGGSTWMTGIETLEDYILGHMTGHQRRVCTRAPSPSVYLPRIFQELSSRLIESFEPPVNSAESNAPIEDFQGTVVESSGRVETEENAGAPSEQVQK